jgi:hypothetical protein
MQVEVREQRGNRPALGSPVTRPLAALDLSFAIRPLDDHRRAEPLPEQPADVPVTHAAGHGGQEAIVGG